MRHRSVIVHLMIALALAAGATGLQGCDASSLPEDRDAIRLSGPTELRFVRTVVRPDLSAATRWLGRSRDLTYDSVSEHLLAINADERFVFEMDLEGNLVRRYGQPGQGPGELDNPLSLAVGPDTVSVLDLGNGKIVRYPRAGGEAVDVRIPYPLDDLLDGENSLMAVPGPGTTAVALPLSDAEGQAGFGSRALLPRRCVRCLLGSAGDDAVAIVETESPELMVVRRDGSVRDRLILGDLELLGQWKREEAEILGTGTFRGGKLWIFDVAFGGGNILLTVTPPRPHERGRELWRVDTSERRIARYTYDRPDVGNDIAVAWPRVFTVGVRNGAILEYEVPPRK